MKLMLSFEDYRPCDMMAVDGTATFKLARMVRTSSDWRFLIAC